MKSLNYLFKEWIVPIVVALIIVFLLNRYVFVLVTVPTGSMENTIMPGDRLYVTKIFDVDDLKIGDIVVFESEELDKILVKRLMGRPGDEVYIDENGIVYTNGSQIDEPYAKNTPQKPQIFNVPEGTYFFMGDNRGSSHDARSWVNPYIPENKLMGIALFRFFPLNRIGSIE
ncbi:MAG: Signal peptidase I [Clostridiales bacterium 38_11]|nr:MAG: Signal peptidase I [Clostridiales bacterium 38_11]